MSPPGTSPSAPKNLALALNISRVSFAPAEKMEEMLGTKIGAATIFGLLLDKEHKITLVFDEAVTADSFYGCSDGTTTGYMKLSTEDVLKRLLPAIGHKPLIIRL